MSRWSVSRAVSPRMLWTGGTAKDVLELYPLSPDRDCRWNPGTREGT